MDSKIEQVKKILENKNISVSVSVLDYSKGEIKPAKDTFCGTIVSSDVDKLSKEIVSALYSEPQVCPKPEQMMICPKPCKDECGHKKEHKLLPICSDPVCPACIPVPSTTASEWMLLTERARNQIIQADIARIMADKDGLDEVPDDIWEDYQGYAAMILAKVSASFSAQLAEALKAQKEHILAEVDKAALTEAQINKAKQDYLEGKYDRELITFKVTRKNWQDVTIAAAQLEAIKKQLRGEGK